MPDDELESELEDTEAEDIAAKEEQVTDNDEDNSAATAEEDIAVDSENTESDATDGNEADSDSDSTENPEKSDSEDSANANDSDESTEETEKASDQKAETEEDSKSTENDKTSEAEYDIEIDKEKEIRELKENLSKDLTIIDEALSDDEFLEKINSRNVFQRFEKYIRSSVNTVSDFEAIAKSKFLPMLMVVGIIAGAAFSTLTWNSKSKEEYKQLIGYIKVNHDLPEGVEGPFNEEVTKIIRNYVRHPERYLKNEHEHHHHALHEMKDPMSIDMSEKYPGLITNEQLLLILEEQDLGKVSAKGTEYTEKINLSGLDLRSIDYKYLNKFIQSNLKEANFEGVVIQDAQFRGANVAGAKFNFATLTDSSFIRAKMNMASFVETELTNSNFYGAKGELVNFEKAFLAGANFKETELLEVQFNGSLLFSANFKDSFLLGADFGGAELRNVNFRRTNLTAANFRKANLEGANFEGANLVGVNFRDADLTNAIFKGAKISKALLAEAKGLTIEQLEEAELAYSAASLPEWVNKSKLSWKRRF